MPRHLFDALHSHSAAMVGEVARVDEVELAVTRVSSVPNHTSPRSPHAHLVIWNDFSFPLRTAAAHCKLKIIS